MQFQLGEQPNWAGKEECTDVGEEFIGNLLNEKVTESLIQRGYAIVKLDKEVTELYSAFHKAFECFSHSEEEHRKKYATLFSQDKYSPNQFHGFSVVAGLKEQFMMRSCGSRTKLITPSIYDGNIDFGVVGMNLYEKLDLLCRNWEYQVMDCLGLERSQVDKILDPLYKVGNSAHREHSNSDTCTSDYVLPEYISSSIMDNFHYFNAIHNDKAEVQKPGTRKEEQFHNNHASHSDSGLMTAVVVTDEPGLEVFDQKLNCWIALERLLHKHIHKLDSDPMSHRKYATVFWADSHVYLKGANLHECMHRVATSKCERYSVVFKQRTSPTATAPRYQEDYELALIQLKSLDTYGK